MSDVVRCQDLQELKREWDAIEARYREQLPDAKFAQNQSELQLIVQNLRLHPRIQWFYFSDSQSGIALRLYDRAFKQAYPRHYRESPQNDGQEWVIVRGYGLGSSGGPCKKEMRAAFGDNCWSASRAPDNDLNNTPETLNVRGMNTDDRIAYFEHPARNNAPGAVMHTTARESNVGEDYLTAVTESLHQFRQVILYGPPGTGKTRLARRAALALLAASLQDSGSSELNVATLSEDEVQKRLDALREEGVFDLVVFHPAYEYEQFVGGIAPALGPAGLDYKIEPGIFLKMAGKVEDEGCPAVLIIDEINRGHLPKLLGELLYALEYRGAKVRLPFVWGEEKRDHLVVPKNLYVIGTMNSSDRSIGHIDVAVRRRFGLHHIEPDPEEVRNFWRDKDSILGNKLADLMTELNSSLDPDRRGELRVGHAYFLADTSRPDLKNQVRRKLTHQVHQLVEEYRQVLNTGDDFSGILTRLDDALS